MSSKNKTDAEMGLQKFTIRIPTAIEQAVKELAQDETRAKNNMYVVLLKEALAMRGIHFDEQNERTEFPVVIPTKVVMPMEAQGPVFWGSIQATLEMVHMEYPGKEGIHCRISFKDVLGVTQYRLVPLLELEPYWYYVRRTGTVPKYDWNVSPVPKELL